MGSLTDSVQPQPQAVPWYKSQRLIALAQVSAILVLGWVLQGLTTHVWDPYQLGALVISNLVVILKDWWSPTIVAPIAMFNRSNPPAP